MNYNKHQWISSFEDAMLRLRPHLSARMLATIAGMAWQRYGAKGQSPQTTAEEWSKTLAV